MAGLREISVDVVSRRGALALAGQVGALITLSACGLREEKAYKPVLYLYPEASTDVTVELSFDGRLTYTYPQPEQGADGSATWSVTAHPDGDLVDAAGRHYPSLFWEGNASKAFSQDEGFVVEAGQESGFLEDKLAVLGLNDREAAEFITFWGPKIAERGTALVTFLGSQYTDVARYRFTSGGQEIIPTTFIRVYIVIGDAPASTVAVPEQVLTPAPARTGFTAVEWGGSEK